jgi:hypothetical protein
MLLDETKKRKRNTTKKTKKNDELPLRGLNPMHTYMHTCMPITCIPSHACMPITCMPIISIGSKHLDRFDGNLLSPKSLSA